MGEGPKHKRTHALRRGHSPEFEKPPHNIGALVSGIKFWCIVYCFLRRGCSAHALMPALYHHGNYL